MYFATRKLKSDKKCDRMPLETMSCNLDDSHSSIDSDHVPLGLLDPGTLYFTKDERKQEEIKFDSRLHMSSRFNDFNSERQNSHQGFRNNARKLVIKP